MKTTVHKYTIFEVSKPKKMKKLDLKREEYNEYYHKYIEKLSDDIELTNGYLLGKKKVIDLFSSINEEKLNDAYQPNKWTIKEVFQHIIDTERIFIYRCFRIAREDKTSLTGFDQNIFIKPSGANKKSREQLLTEYKTNRNNSINIIDSLSDKNLSTIGNLAGNHLSARAAAFIILGHEIWHTNIIKERYL